VVAVDTTHPYPTNCFREAGVTCGYFEASFQSRKHSGQAFNQGKLKACFKIAPSKMLEAVIDFVHKS